jgi:hypothetical protein
MTLRRTLLGTAAAAAVVAPLTAYATSSAGPASPLALAQATADRLGTTLAADDSALASDNVSLVSTIPGSYVGLRVVGKRAFATGWDGLTSFDISDPAHPVPTGVLPLPHFENEDVDSDGRIALVSNDREKASTGGVLYVVDVSHPTALRLASVLDLSDLGSDQRGPGHIANCVGPHGCRWAWVTGGRKIWVVDLRKPESPRLVRGFETPVSTGSMDFGGRGEPHAGATHDVERDAQGRLWVTGSGGMAVYSAANPVRPRLLAYTGKTGLDPRNNQFILHNSVHPDAAAYRARPAGRAGGPVRRGEVLLMTEENYTDTNTDDAEPMPGGCREQGRFETWDVRSYSRGRTPTVLDKWTTEVSGTPYLTGNHAPVTVFCSSHWFSERKGWVADGWYEQGTRLLDVRDPAHIRQVGYWAPPNAVTWAAYWVTDHIVYAADVGRGLDVLRVAGGAGSDARTVTAPVRASWLGAAPNLTQRLVRESRRWSFFCAQPAVHALR